MILSRRRFLGATGAVLAAPAIARPAFAQAQVTLKLHHFLPPVSNGHSKMLAPWAKMVEEDSGGKMIDIFLHAARRYAASAFRSGPRRRRRHRLDVPGSTARFLHGGIRAAAVRGRVAASSMLTQA